MTTTSFQSRQSGCSDAFRSGRDADPSAMLGVAGASSDYSPPPQVSGYAAETQRMKAFAGQRQFRAPVADDFTRGMQAPAQVAGASAPPLKRVSKVPGGLVAGLASLWRHLSG